MKKTDMTGDPAAARAARTSMAASLCSARKLLRAYVEMRIGGGESNDWISRYGMSRIVSATGVPTRRSGAIARSPAVGSPFQQTPTPNAGPVASGKMPLKATSSSGALSVTSR